MAIKTKPTDEDVEAFLHAVPSPRRREEGLAMLDLLREVTGEPGQMWGPTMVGFGSQPYTNSLGTNNWFILGFSPRSTALTIYGIWNGYEETPDPRFADLGPHTTGKACLYVKNLDKIDLDLLRTMAIEAWAQYA